MVYYRNFQKLNNADPKPEKSEKKKTAYVFKKKPTGEAAVFKKIWEERGPYSQINNEYLGEYNVWYFAHVIPKGKNKYPHFKLLPANIILMSYSQHHLWDNNRTKCVGPEWDFMHELEAELKAAYKATYQ